MDFIWERTGLLSVNNCSNLVPEEPRIIGSSFKGLPGPEETPAEDKTIPYRERAPLDEDDDNGSLAGNASANEASYQQEVTLNEDHEPFQN